MNIRAERFPRPPDKRRTAAPAGNRRDGKDSFSDTLNANQNASKKQDTPCHKCRWYDGDFIDRKFWKDKKLHWGQANRPNPVSGQRWSGCYLAATRDPGRRCPHFRERGERADIPHNDAIQRRLDRAHRAGALPEAAFRWAKSYLKAARRRGFTPTDAERAVLRRILSEYAGEDGRP